jgi:hypothetical protein
MMDKASLIESVTTAVSVAGGAVTALDVVQLNGSRMVVDTTCNSVDEPDSKATRLLLPGDTCKLSRRI